VFSEWLIAFIRENPDAKAAQARSQYPHGAAPAVDTVRQQIHRMKNPKKPKKNPKKPK
jgi:hypothetical protein